MFTNHQTYNFSINSFKLPERRALNALTIREHANNRLVVKLYIVPTKSVITGVTILNRPGGIGLEGPALVGPTFELGHIVLKI